MLLVLLLLLLVLFVCVQLLMQILLSLRQSVAIFASCSSFVSSEYEETGEYDDDELGRTMPVFLKKSCLFLRLFIKFSNLGLKRRDGERERGR